MLRTITIRRRALFDMTRISQSIAENVSEKSGSRWLTKAHAGIAALANDAEQWPQAEEAHEVNRDLRCRLFGRRRHVYRILFIIEGDNVIVHRIRHAAQDYLAEDDL